MNILICVTNIRSINMLLLESNTNSNSINRTLDILLKVIIIQLNQIPPIMGLKILQQLKSFTDALDVLLDLSYLDIMTTVIQETYLETVIWLRIITIVPNVKTTLLELSSTMILTLTSLLDNVIILPYPTVPKLIMSILLTRRNLSVRLVIKDTTITKVIKSVNQVTLQAVISTILSISVLSVFLDSLCISQLEPMLCLYVYQISPLQT